MSSSFRAKEPFRRSSGADEPTPAPGTTRVAAGSWQLVAEEGALEGLLGVLAGVDEYAIDTEFHRERTYFPHLALVQIAWSGGIALVDPLAVDMTAFASLFASQAVAVLHAADQDLEVLERSCGALPKQIFDTQLSAGFLGFTSPSLATLAEALLGIRLHKWIVFLLHRINIRI